MGCTNSKKNTEYRTNPKKSRANIELTKISDEIISDETAKINELMRTARKYTTEIEELLIDNKKMKCYSKFGIYLRSLDARMRYTQLMIMENGLFELRLAKKNYHLNMVLLLGNKLLRRTIKRSKS